MSIVKTLLSPFRVIARTLRPTSVRQSLSRMPTVRHFVTVSCFVVVAIGVSAFIGSAANGLMAGGAAITIAVLGLSWLTGLSGQVSIGNSGFMAVGGYAAGIWAFHHAPPQAFGQAFGPAEWSILIALALALIFGALSGLIVGIPGTRLRGPYLAGFTLAFAVVLPQFIQTLSYTGGSGGLTSITPPQPPAWFVNFFSGDAAKLNSTAQWLTDFVVVIAGITFFLMANLFNSKSGRAMRLVRDNDVAAELVGINLPRARTMAFVVSAALGGLSGWLSMYVSQGVTPGSFSLTLSISLLTVMVLGGIGTLSGAVIGGVIYAFSGNLVSRINSLTGIDPNSQWGINMKGILFGGVLIITMLLAPRGIVGLGSRMRSRIRS